MAHHTSEPYWQAPNLFHYRPTQTIQAWLLDPDSLTQKLVELSKGSFRVEVLQQSIARPQLSEARRLNLGYHRWAVIREVILHGNHQPWVYARSVIPLSTLRGPLRQLNYLGNRPLGEMLFRDPTMRRKHLELAGIKASHLPQMLQEFTPSWGRRSVFLLRNKPLLVSEIFLSSFFQQRNFCL